MAPWRTRFVLFVVSCSFAPAALAWPFCTEVGERWCIGDNTIASIRSTLDSAKAKYDGCRADLEQCAYQVKDATHRKALEAADAAEPTLARMGTKLKDGVDEGLRAPYCEKGIGKC